MYENAMTPADMAAVMNRNGSYGDMGFGGGAWWWIIILFLFGMNGGWGRGGFGYGNGNDYNAGVGSEVQRGFDQSAVMGGLNSLSNAVTSGFGNVQTALCGGFAGVNQGMASGFAGVNAGIANGFAQAEISENGRQMANMNQMFGLQTGLSNQLNTIAMNQQQCLNEGVGIVNDAFSFTDYETVGTLAA